MKIYFKNKIISIGDGSKVYDENNNPVLKIKGNVFTLTRKKRIYDLDGKLLFKVRRKYWHMFKESAYIMNSKGKKIMQLRDRKRVLGSGFDILKCSENYEIVWGGFGKGKNKVLKDGQQIGVISRQVLSLVDTFVIDLEDSRYIPLLVAITTAIDCIYDGD